MVERDWHVLLIGGGTGCGKTTLSQQLARHFDVGVLEGDVLRWVIASAVEGSDPELQARHEPSFWDQPWQEILQLSLKQSERLCEISQVVLVRHHFVNRPLILEGFWVLPEFAAQSSFNGIEITGRVRSLFLYEPDIDALKERLYDRDGERGIPSDQPGRLRMFHEHGLLIKQRAEALGLPTLEARPFETLLERALAALS